MPFLVQDIVPMTEAKPVLKQPYRGGQVGGSRLTKQLWQDLRHGVRVRELLTLCLRFELGSTLARCVESQCLRHGHSQLYGKRYCLLLPLSFPLPLFPLSSSSFPLIKKNAPPLWQKPYGVPWEKITPVTSN